MNSYKIKGILLAFIALAFFGVAEASKKDTVLIVYIEDVLNSKVFNEMRSVYKKEYESIQRKWEGKFKSFENRNKNKKGKGLENAKQEYLKILEEYKSEIAFAEAKYTLGQSKIIQRIQEISEKILKNRRADYLVIAQKSTSNIVNIIPFDKYVSNSEDMTKEFVRLMPKSFRGLLPSNRTVKEEVEKIKKQAKNG